ncbi:MAG: ChaN family lipoprotein [Bdellovibrionia bacterium]
MVSSKPPAHKKALRLQRKILQSLKAEANLLLGQTPESILRYERENRKDFSLNSKRLKTIPKATLIEAIRAADVTFIADFHTFDQAQRAALRIFRDAIQPGEYWMIGLEMVPSQFQSALDDFQTGKISLESFHEAISYRDEWGFPWENYAPIFEWARNLGIRLIALNRPRGIFKPKDDRELHERDQWAAGIITDLFCEARLSSIPKMFVLYGELHIGSHHLPLRLKEISKSFLGHSLSSVIIHQNEDQLFWRAAKEELDLQSEAILLKKNIYCIFSGTPWAELQSLISWTEGGTPDLNEDENEVLIHDYLYMIRTYGETISEFLNLAPPSYEALNVYTIEQPDFLDHLKQCKQFTQLELRLIRFHVTHNRYFYIPRVSAAYLGSSSHNAAAELSAIHLLRAKNQSGLLYSNKVEDFYRLTLEACFGFFGSLILNPLRKCDFVKDHVKRLQTLKNGEKPAFPLEKEAREILVHGLRSPHELPISITQIINEQKLAPAVMVGARYIGRILGKKLHHAILTEKINFKNIEGVFLDKPTAAKRFFEIRYKTLINAIVDIEVGSTKTEYF